MTEAHISARCFYFPPWARVDATSPDGRLLVHRADELKASLLQNNSVFSYDKGQRL